MSDLQARLDRLPKYYTYRDVLTLVFDGDEEALTLAFADGTLPQPVRESIYETAGDRLLIVLLLRLMVRQQAALLARLGPRRSEPV